MPIDFEIGGVYLPPIAQALLLAIPIFMLLDWCLRRLGVLRLVWQSAPGGVAGAGPAGGRDDGPHCLRFVDASDTGVR